ncbi:hypothetical protein LCGC14_1279770 [marine sediment metagenome]|uniref:Rubredoxin-like domain-containing protein n=1 Tax=marine sediment metagenome TaxID=412755 RepID=A0A0F9KXD1_9ZZZZ
MKSKVICNQCNHVYIQPDRPYPECPECGHTSVTFIEFTEAELAADAETAMKFIEG